MNKTVFVEFDFFALIIFSLILPVALYGYMMWKRVISRHTVLLFAVILIMLSGVDVFLLQRLKLMARLSTSLLDDTIFRSELSLALYLIPAVFAGIGVNMISHVLVSHLTDAENKFDSEQSLR